MYSAVVAVVDLRLNEGLNLDKLVVEDDALAFLICNPSEEPSDCRGGLRLILPVPFGVDKDLLNPGRIDLLLWVFDLNDDKNLAKNVPVNGGSVGFSFEAVYRSIMRWWLVKENISCEIN